MTKTAAFFLACALFAFPAAAEPYISAGGGAFNINRDDTAAEFQVEYQGEALRCGFAPIGGLNVTSDGGVYGYGGVNYHINLPANFYLLPSFAVGLYEEGSGIDLGGPLEFRSSIEGGYQFQNGHRLSAGLRHLSNASIYDRNPGEESVVVLYSAPLSSLARLGGK